jgi:AraC-like DNA-binding protein
MITNNPDFARYLPSSPLTQIWGVAVTGGGTQAVGPGEMYPPEGHPADHGFTWEEGRVLGAMQLVLILRGEGRFESRACALRSVRSGDVFMLPPRSWHRYRPDRATGWEELWIELEGPVVDRLISHGVLASTARVVASHRPAGFERVLREIHTKLSGTKASSNDAERGALGLQALAMLVGETSSGGAHADRASWVQVAEQRMAADLRDAPRAETLARELGVSYSHFRREFRRVTGMAPHRYLARLRLNRARRMLGSSSVGLDQLADRLGYSSAFHLSAAFKQEFGVAPKTWRALAAREGEVG